MKKKYLLLAVALVMAIGTIIGGTMAAYQASTDTTKKISTSAVDITLEVSPIATEGDGISYQASDIEDGYVKQEVRAVNEGAKPVYIRVAVNKAWFEGEEKVFTMEGKGLDSNQIAIETANENDWIIMDEDIREGNGEQIYFYYRHPLQADTKTDIFITGFNLLKNANENTNRYSGLQAVIRYDADAIQLSAAEDAMLAEWGVEAKIDASTGTIKSIDGIQ